MDGTIGAKSVGVLSIWLVNVVWNEDECSNGAAEFRLVFFILFIIPHLIPNVYLLPRLRVNSVNQRENHGSEKRGAGLPKVAKLTGRGAYRGSMVSGGMCCFRCNTEFCASTEFS